MATRDQHGATDAALAALDTDEPTAMTERVYRNHHAGTVAVPTNTDYRHVIYHHDLVGVWDHLADPLPRRFEYVAADAVERVCVQRHPEANVFWAVVDTGGHRVGLDLSHPDMTDLCETPPELRTRAEVDAFDELEPPLTGRGTDA